MQSDVDTRIMEELASAMVNRNLELTRKALSEIFLPRGDDLNYPHCREYYEDFVEVLAECFGPWEDPLYGVVLIDATPYEWETAQELQFLAWIRQLVQRGYGFEEAFNEAKKRLIELVDQRHGLVVYDLEEHYHILVEAWEERRTARGIEPRKAHDMAEDIVQLLRQLYLIEADDELVDEFFSDYERKLRHLLLERLGNQAETDLEPVRPSLAAGSLSVDVCG